MSASTTSLLLWVTAFALLQYCGHLAAANDFTVLCDLVIQNEDINHGSWKCPGGPYVGWHGVEVEDGTSDIVGLTIVGRDFHSNDNWLTVLQGLTNLEELYLEDNAIRTGVSQITRFTTLEELSITHNQLTGTMPAIELANLEVLDLSNNEIVQSLPNFPNMGNLEVLRLANNQIAGAIPWDFSKFVNLEELDVSGNAIGGEIPSSYSSLTALTLLNLKDNGFNSGLSNVVRITSLEVLDLANNGFAGPLPSQFTDLSLLRYLSLEGMSVTNSKQLPCIRAQIRFLIPRWRPFAPLASFLLSFFPQQRPSSLRWPP